MVLLWAKHKKKSRFWYVLNTPILRQGDSEYLLEDNFIGMKGKRAHQRQFLLLHLTRYVEPQSEFVASVDQCKGTG